MNAFNFEEALKTGSKNNMMPTVEDMNQIISNLSLRRRTMGSSRSFFQIDLRLKALKIGMS